MTLKPKTGIVQIGGKDIVISVMSVHKELALGTALGKRYRSTLGPGSYFAKAQPALQWIRENNPQAFGIAVQHISTMVACDEPPSPTTIEEFRQTGAGAALEMFWRTRETQPEITEAQLQAVINDMNALEVYLQIAEIVSRKDESGN